jgi:hypothetical protein
MSFLKKHYEKILLGVVLVGLVVAAAFLPVMISAERSALEDKRSGIIKRPVKPLAAPDLSRAEALLARLAAPFSLDFATTNRLFNPVRWAKRPDGTWYKVPTGSIVEKLEVTKITPLYLRIRLKDVRTSDSSGPRYELGIQREAAADPRLRSERSLFLSRGEKKEGYTIREASGPADNPVLTLESSELNEPISLSKDKPFSRVEDYSADLVYPPDKRSFPNRRATHAGTLNESTLILGGQIYKIVAINANEVVLSGPNEKKHTIKFDAASEAR